MTGEKRVGGDPGKVLSHLYQCITSGGKLLEQNRLLARFAALAAGLRPGSLRSARPRHSRSGRASGRGLSPPPPAPASAAAALRLTPRPGAASGRGLRPRLRPCRGSPSSYCPARGRTGSAPPLGGSPRPYALRALRYARGRGAAARPRRPAVAAPGRGSLPPVGPCGGRPASGPSPRPGTITPRVPDAILALAGGRDRARPSPGGPPPPHAVTTSPAARQGSGPCGPARLRRRCRGLDPGPRLWCRKLRAWAPPAVCVCGGPPPGAD